jgi:hypothetical protein
MSQLPIKSAPEAAKDSWVKASWEEYLQALTLAAYEKAKGYYHHGQMRLEMSPLGNPHSRDHLILSMRSVCLPVCVNLILTGMIIAPTEK